MISVLLLHPWSRYVQKRVELLPNCKMYFEITSFTTDSVFFTLLTRFFGQRATTWVSIETNNSSDYSGLSPTDSDRRRQRRTKRKRDRVRKRGHHGDRRRPGFELSNDDPITSVTSVHNRKRNDRPAGLSETLALFAGYFERLAATTPCRVPRQTSPNSSFATH